MERWWHGKGQRLIWLAMFILACSMAGCVFILGDENQVSQQGVDLEAHTDIDDHQKKGPDDPGPEVLTK